MSEFAGKRSRTEQAGSTAAAAPQAPGRSTLVTQMYGAAAAVQQRADASASAEQRVDDVHAAAARGVATPAGALPHGNTIQRLFGRHDISSVKAHTGKEAAASAQAMGADAYATDDHIVLGRGPDLFTEAHEAAHTVQQRAGVHLKGGVGEVGDPYERHADEVAAQVVQGKSAEALLDRYAGPSSAHTASAATPVQRIVKVNAERGPASSRKGKLVGGTALTDVDAAWAEVVKVSPDLAKQPRAREILARWISSDAAYEDMSKVSENRVYETYEGLARALAGEVGSEPNLANERKLAETTMSEGEVNGLVGQFITRLKTAIDAMEGNSELQSVNKRTGRYGGWAYPQGTSFSALFAHVPADLTGRIGFVADYALAARKALGTGTKFRMAAALDESRETHHNTDESTPWVQSARAAAAPLSAGPSATTAQVLALAEVVEAPQPEKNALAWALFTAWNTMPMHQTGTHRFHEVMAVAKGYGVPYEDFTYPEAPPRAGEGSAQETT